MDRENSSEEDLLTAVINLGPAQNNGYNDSAVPIMPQRHPGHAMVLAYSAVRLNIGDMGHVPIVMDLKLVGGNYYPTVLPSRVSYDDLHHFVLPQAKADMGNFLFFVGINPVACAPWTDIRLQPGDVVTVQTSLRPLTSYKRLSQLFHPAARWAPLIHIPRTSIHQATGSHMPESDMFSIGVMPQKGKPWHQQSVACWKSTTHDLPCLCSGHCGSGLTTP